VIARVEPLTTTRRLAGPFDYALPDAPVAVGSVVRVPFGRQALDGVVVGLADTTEVPAERLVTPREVRADSVPEELVALALWMADEYCSTPARALSLVLPPRGRPRTELWAGRTAAPLDGERLTANQRALLAALPRAAGRDLSALRRLEARGLVAIGPRDRRRSPLTVAHADAEVELTDAQRVAVAAVAEGSAQLLHGVTGSGKTEVYLRAAAAALERGRGVIVLVPEIALTPQTVGRFRARFGDTVALLHSALGEGERYDEWRRLRTGEARIAVGPRSAVFAPVRELGLIVVDEEHETSSKNGEAPRYRIQQIQITNDPLLVRNGHAESRKREFFSKRQKIAQVCRFNQKWQIHRVRAARLKRAIVYRRRNRMPHRIRDHPVRSRIARKFLDAIEMPQLVRANLPRGSAFRSDRRRVRVQTPRRGRQDPRGETHFAHRQQHGRRARIRARERQHA